MLVMEASAAFVLLSHVEALLTADLRGPDWLPRLLPVKSITEGFEGVKTYQLADEPEATIALVMRSRQSELRCSSDRSYRLFSEGHYHVLGLITGPSSFDSPFNLLLRRVTTLP